MGGLTQGVARTPVGKKPLDVARIALPQIGEFLEFKHSMKDVRRAGEALAGKISWSDGQNAEHAIRVFAVRRMLTALPRSSASRASWTR